MRALVVVVGCLMVTMAMTRAERVAEAAPAALDISIVTPADVEARRTQLRSLIWPAGYPATRRPDAVTAPAQPYDIWATMPNAADVTVFAVYQPHGVNVTGWYIRPKVSNGRSIIVHQGHDGGPLGSPDWAAIHGRFVAYGFDVVVLTMPLLPPNPDPNGWGHNELEALRTPTFHPFSLFLDPTIAALNFLQQRTGRSAAYMTGLSGGGWTTTLAAAIEPRILKSYPVAGSLPMDIRTPGEIADWEQHDAQVYDLASYEDLYILGAVGSGRGQIQILNQFDACCFSYAGRESQINGYVGPVHDRAQQLGGAYYLWVDQGQHGHTISQAAFNIMMGDMGAQPLPTPTPTMAPTRSPTPFVFPATPTPLVLPTRQPTSTTVAAGSCSPRPPVKVQTTAIPGGIRVDVTAQTPISGLTLGTVRNATTSAVSIVGGAATFTATRQGQGAIHVPFVVTDACGAWPTFVGQGG